MTFTDTSSEPPVDKSAPRGKRAWRHSIGGKLLIAFGLIAALTIGAAFLSLVRFGQIESVLRGLVDVSMPALKLSMDVQSRTADVIETAAEVGNAQNEVERFNGMSTATDRIGTLWQAIARLRAVVIDDRTMRSDPGADRPNRFPGRRPQPNRERRPVGESGTGQAVSADRGNNRHR